MTTIAHTKETLTLIENANTVIARYREGGLNLTLRQLYYRLVSGGYFPNTNGCYRRLEGIINDGRLAGVVNRDAIVDCTRNVVFQPRLEDPKAIIENASEKLIIDKWKGQYYRLEIWVEKESIAKVLASYRPELGVPYVLYQGDVSPQSAQRLLRYHNAGQQPIILYLGGYDPSNIDTTWDISTGVNPSRCPVEIKRIALNENQVDKYNLLSNPSKDDTWELDALEPSLLLELVTRAVLKVRSKKHWDAKVKEEEKRRGELQAIADNYEDVIKWLEVNQ